MGARFASRTSKLIGQARNERNANVRGKLFEDLICHIFEAVIGVSVRNRNVKNVFHTEEIDVLLWNDQHKRGLPFLPFMILVECKNWSQPVGSEQVAWFKEKLESRGLEVGILFAANGIAGDAEQLTAAHRVVAGALKGGRRILVLTTDDVARLKQPADLGGLLKQKLCDLVAQSRIG